MCWAERDGRNQLTRTLIVCCRKTHFSPLNLDCKKPRIKLRVSDHVLDWIGTSRRALPCWHTRELTTQTACTLVSHVTKSSILLWPGTNTLSKNMQGKLPITQGRPPKWHGNQLMMNFCSTGSNASCAWKSLTHSLIWRSALASTSRDSTFTASCAKSHF